VDNIRLLGTEPQPPAGPKIIWVSFHGADDAPSAGAAGQGFTQAPDKGYTDLLKANGYNVTRYIQTSTPDVNVLNAADLVIVSRSVAGGSFQNAAATAWNGISAPMIIVGDTIRAGRLGFTTGNTYSHITGDITLTVNDPNHPIFTGISLTNGTMTNPYAGVVVYPTDGTLAHGMMINTDAPNANGTVLATVSAAGNGPAGVMIIGEWPAGATVTHDGGAAATDVLAGHRLAFQTSSCTPSGKNLETLGMYDLYPDGAQMFLNAVKYMIPAKPKVIWVSRHGADDAPSAGAAGQGFTEAPDKGYTDLLTANGYDVTRYIGTGTPDVNVLKAADLVIIGRNNDAYVHYHYSNGGATTWNGISAPMIIMHGYTLQTCCLGYTTGGTMGQNMVDTTGDITLTVNDPNHPIFAGIPLTVGTMTNPYAGLVVYPTDGTTVTGGISIDTDPLNGGGTVLATVSAAGNGPVGGTVIAEWAAGATLTHGAEPGTDTLGGHRLVFLTGARQASGKSVHTAGIYDLSADGAQMFLNAVQYMLK